MTLLEIVEDTFESASNSEVGQKIFKEVDGDVLELSVTDGENIHIIFQDAAAQVRTGSIEDELDVHTISGDTDAFLDLFEGRTRIVEATWEGKIGAEVYHGRPDLYFALQQSIKICVPALEPEPF